MSDEHLATWGERQAQAIATRHERWISTGLTPALGRLTGVGAMRGMEIVDAEGKPAPAQLTRLLTLARERGLLLMPSGKARHIVRLLAPLTIEPAVLEEGLDILEQCLADL